MKRKASRAPGYERPSKLTKESTDASISQSLNSVLRRESTKKPALQPLKFPSCRKKTTEERSSPYPTRSNTIGQKSSSAAWPKFPALVPPSKQRSSVKKEVGREGSSQEETGQDKNKGDDVVPTSLRKRSTVKLENSPPQISKSKSKRNSTSLAKKDTEILMSSDSRSSESSVIRRSSKPSASASPPINASSKLPSKLSKKRKSTKSAKRN